MLQRVREWLVLVLIVLLPFHALFVTVGTRNIVGPGHAPFWGLAVWKELVLAVVLVLAMIEVLRNKKIKNKKISMDVLDWLVLGLFVLSVLVPITYHLSVRTDVHPGGSPITYLYGFRYTLLPLILFCVLRRVRWSDRFSFLVARSSLLVGAIVAVYGIVTLFLPETFFTWLGYSALHSLYLPDGPIAAFQKIEGTGIRRIQSTFSGPNQLGMWLLMPWSIGLIFLAKQQSPFDTTSSFCVIPSDSEHCEGSYRGSRRSWSLRVTRLLACFITLAVGIALFFTFSRAAWIGAMVILVVALWQMFSTRLARFWLFVTGCSLLIVLLVVGATMRPRSTVEHLRRPLQAIQIIVEHPLGLGLGSAGPASNRTSDPCVFLEGGADVSWANDRSDLCVFVDNQQVQPAGRACRCPFLPENWYVQVGVELGVLGLVLYVLLVIFVGSFLVSRSSSQSSSSLALRTTHYALLTFLGISIAALFLHAWEDSAVAYTVWMLLATTLPVQASRATR